MAIKAQIDALLQEKMDRKDFLKYAGTIVLSVVGITGLVRMLLVSHGSTPHSTGQQSSGYGGSRYGE